MAVQSELGIQMRNNLLVFGLALLTSANAQWTVTSLHPAGATSSSAQGVHGPQQVGYAVIGGSLHAGLWTGSSESWVDLHPTGAVESVAYAACNGEQVGYAHFGAGKRASRWIGTAESWIDLHPSIASESIAYGAEKGEQAGYSKVGQHERAGVWTGASNSWVDFHVAGALESEIRGLSQGRQAGTVFFGGFDARAALWDGSAKAWENLHPAGTRWSQIFGIDGEDQVGYVFVDTVQRAARWKGSAESWIDLHPAAANTSLVRSTHRGVHVGRVFFGTGSRASLWRGTPSSWMNLHEFLSANFTGSEAQGVWVDGAMTYVVGVGSTQAQTQEAVMWVSEDTGPIDFNVLRGVVTSGSLGALQASDDIRLMVRPGLVFSTAESPVQLRIDGLGTSPSPHGFSFSLESSASFGNAQQNIFLWNFDSAAYELVDSRIATLADDYADVTIRTNPSRFIEDGTMAVRALVTFRAIGPSFSYPWLARIDKVNWKFPG